MKKSKTKCLVFLKRIEEAQFFKIMRVTVFLLLLGMSNLFAGETYSQSTKFSFNMKNITLGQLFEEIQKQSEFNIFYKDSQVDLNRKVDVVADKASVEEILKQALKEANLDFKVFERQIVIFPARILYIDNIEIEEISAEQPQQKEITGKVTDEGGLPLPGVTVIVKGTTIGTVTNADGEFSLNVPLDAETLQYSFVGMRTQEIPIEGRTTFSVVMEEETIGIEEVVAIAYGQQRRESVTASIAQVTGAEIANVPATNLGSALTGRLPGLVTIQLSDQPGASDPRLYMRGIGTMNDTDPLVIIDGIPSDMRSFMQLSPNTIENISILKDASATAVYGVRGANGVVIAQTKRGIAGENRISVDQSFSVQIPHGFFEHANAFDWATAYNEAHVTDGFPQNQLSDKLMNILKNKTQPLIYPDTQDPMRELVKDFAFNSQTNVSISGGTENTKFFVALGYLNNDGIFKTELGGPQKTYNFSYNRYNLRANLDLSVTPSTKARFTSFARIGQKREPSSDGLSPFDWAQTFGKVNPFSGAGLNTEEHPGKYILPNERYTPVRPNEQAIERIYGQGYQDVTENELNLNIGIDQNLDAITKGLKASVDVSYRSGFNESASRVGGDFPKYIPIYRADIPYNPVPGDSTVVLQKIGSHTPDTWNGSYSARRSIYWDVRMNYNRSFSNHNLAALLLYNQSKNYYPGGQFSSIPSGYLGLVGRITYDYDNRYLFEFNVGYNGSENFHPDVRYGFFPAISAGWNLANETFMQGVGFINRLKLRGSIGQVGNDRHGGQRFLYLPDQYRRNNDRTYGYNFGVDIPQFQYGAYPYKLGNPNVTWETATKYNAGIDLGLFDNRFTIEADYFYEWREDILITKVNIPAFINSVVDIPPVNYGIVENSGFETDVRWRHKVGDFSYHVSGSATFARNKVIQTDEVPPLEPYQSAIGRSLNTNFGYIALGLYTEEEVEQVNAGVLPAPVGTQVKPGYVRYEDLNGDGIINERDRKEIGYPRVPRVNFAGELGLSYKSWSLSTTWQGTTQVSREIGGFLKSTFEQSWYGLLKGNFDERWTQEKIDQGIEPGYYRLTIQDRGYNEMGSSYWVKDASYIRLKSASLGYTFERPFWSFQQLGVYLQGYNLLTFTRFPNYKYNDPEKDSGHGQNDVEAYPMIRLINLSVNVTF
jgi:TonB-linked SusC/RagA family outer membrane protein